MRIEKLVGFIVYGFPLGEADQIISCFTSGGNLTKFIAKGSRKVKSKSAASVQLFVLGEYILYRGKGLPILRQGDIIDSLAPIRKDWAKSGAAFAAMELCRLLVEEEAREVEAFQLLMEYLHHLKNNPYDSIVFDSFRLKFAASLGYEMNFEFCSQCGVSLSNGWLDWPSGGAVCTNCRGQSTTNRRLSKDELIFFDSLGKKSFLDLQDKQSSIAVSVVKAVDGLINWLTQGKTKAQAFRSMFEK